MSSRPLALLALLAALGLAGFWFMRSAPGAEDVGVPAVLSGEHTGAELAEQDVVEAIGEPTPAVASPGESDTARTPVAEEASADEPPDDRLTGEVHDVHGRPLPGARVEVRRRASTGTSSLDLDYNRVLHPVGTCETDDRGRFSLPVPEHRPLEVRIRAAGHATAMLDNVFGGEHLAVNLVAGAVLEGRITSKSTGLGVPGVHLRGWSQGATDAILGDTDATGGFRFDGLPVGELTLVVEPDVLAAPEWRGIALEAGAVVRADFVLEDGIAIRGQVTDERSGAPIVGAVVGAGWWYDRPVTTDQDGRYLLPGFGGPGVYDIHARAAGYGKAQHEFEYDAMPTEEVQLDFALPPARAAIGRVVGPEGAGAEGVYIAAVGTDFDKGGQRHDWEGTYTDSDGRFRFSSLTPDLRHQLLVRPDGLAVLIHDFPMDEMDHEVLDLGTIELLPAARMVGVVVDGEGQPRPDIRLVLKGRGDAVGRYEGDPVGNLSLSYTENRESSTDRRGRFHFADLAPGTYRLTARVKGSPTQASLMATVTAGQLVDDLVLVIPIGLAIRGHVLDPDGQPCRRVMMRLSGVAQTGSTPTTDAEGAFEITGLDPGRYTLRADTMLFNYAEDEERELYETVVQDVEAGTDDLRIVLRAIAPITGLVREADGSVPVNIAVEAYDTVTRKKLAHERVDSDGGFRLALPAGAVVDLETRSVVDLESGGYTTQVPGERTVWLLGIEAGSEGVVLELGR